MDNKTNKANKAKKVTLSQVPENSVVLFDSCSYLFYRVTATISWWNHQENKGSPGVDNPEFMDRLTSQCLSHFDTFIKKSRVDPEQIFLVRDCPRQEIWRNSLFSDYKGTRTDNSTTIGPMIKHLYGVIAPRFGGRIIRVAHAEADDTIAVLTRFFLELNGSTDSQQQQQITVTIVANDSDYNQLLKYPGVSIINPKAWTPVVCPDPEQHLEKKLVTGDKSDNIPSIKTILNREGEGSQTFRSAKLQNRQLMDFDYIPRAIQDAVITALFEVVEGLGLTGDQQQKGLTDTIKRTVNKDTMPGSLRSTHIPLPVQLGLCCLNKQLRDQGVFCSRKPIIKTIKDNGMERLLSRCTMNAEDLIRMIEWNHQHGIRVLRISSDIFPHFTTPDVPRYDLDFVQPLLTKAGVLARRYGQRLTFHPGQYNVVGTPFPDKLANTAKGLDYHAEVLDRIGCPVDSVMVVHGGGIYDDKPQTIQRWIQQYQGLPDRVKRRLVLENCEKCFHIEDCLYVSREVNIPVVFDTHHYDCYKKLHPEQTFRPPQDYISEILGTWTRRGIKPKFHVSEQGSGRTGHHSKYIQEIPQYLMEIPERYGISIDIMIEAKMQEQAIISLYHKYPQLNPLQKSTTSASAREVHYLGNDRPHPKITQQSPPPSSSPPPPLVKQQHIVAPPEIVSPVVFYKKTLRSITDI